MTGVPTTVGAAGRDAASLLRAVGVPPTRAEATAEAIVLAEAWGIASHGLLRLPFYLDRLQQGGIRADADLVTVRDTGPLVSYDGQDGLGHWQLARAATVAVERAQHYGLAAVGVARSSHCGALGIYVLPMPRAGLIGLAFSNGPAVMPPWGGHAPVFSTSPIAAGLPTRPRPTIVDMATSTVARGKIAARAQRGEPLPPGWALDATGAPTTDPRAALTGMLAPLGGPKGAALALLVESLTGAMIGPALATGVADMLAPGDAAVPQRIAHLLLAIDPGLLDGDGRGRERLDELAATVVASGGRLPGTGRLDPHELDPAQELVIAEGTATALATWRARLLPPPVATAARTGTP